MKGWFFIGGFFSWKPLLQFEGFGDRVIFSLFDKIYLHPVLGLYYSYCKNCIEIPVLETVLFVLRVASSAIEFKSYYKGKFFIALEPGRLSLNFCSEMFGLHNLGFSEKGIIERLVFGWGILRLEASSFFRRMSADAGSSCLQLSMMLNLLFHLKVAAYPKVLVSFL